MTVSEATRLVLFPMLRARLFFEGATTLLQHADGFSILLQHTRARTSSSSTEKEKVHSKVLEMGRTENSKRRLDENTSTKKQTAARDKSGSSADNNSSQHCAGSHEDCSSLRCCADPALRCYKKDQYWSGCIPPVGFPGGCTPGGTRLEDGAEWSHMPWVCEYIDVNPLPTTTAPVTTTTTTPGTGGASSTSPSNADSSTGTPYLPVTWQNNETNLAPTGDHDQSEVQDGEVTAMLRPKGPSLNCCEGGSFTGDVPQAFGDEVGAATEAQHALHKAQDGSSTHADATSESEDEGHHLSGAAQPPPSQAPVQDSVGVSQR
ncbi:unnamed protein product [Amoebophrya sp. A120]|nr:unnamed protein product [Amoebophrya sp. A120]|eukprot:GSA120T00019387001.1